MRMGWGTAVCGVVLGVAAGFVCGHVSAWTRAAARPSDSLPVLNELPPLAALPLSTVDVDAEHDGPIFFPERMTPPLPDFAEPETVHADAVVETSGEFGAPLTREPDELLHPSDAEPLPSGSQETLRAILDTELADLTKADREVWLDVLEGLPLADAVGIVRLWKKFGNGPGVLAGSPAAIDQDELNPLPSGAMPLPFAENLSQSPSLAVSPRTSLDTARRLYIQNLLCAETYGYRRIEPLFAMPSAGSASAGATLQCVGSRINHNQGEMVPTSVPLDVAIEGDGFFVVTHPEEGPLYTRCGQFSRAADGRLVLYTSCGELPVTPEIVIPETASSVGISPEGEVAITASGEQSKPVGVLSLALFVAPAQLQWRSDALLSATEQSGAAQMGHPAEGARGKLLQGQLERSNVQNPAETAWLRQLEEWQQLTSQ